MIGGHLLHGGDYNPEQWIEYPEILEEDLHLPYSSTLNLLPISGDIGRRFKVDE